MQPARLGLTLVCGGDYRWMHNLSTTGPNTASVLNMMLSRFASRLSTVRHCACITRVSSQDTVPTPHNSIKHLPFPAYAFLVVINPRVFFWVDPGGGDQRMIESVFHHFVSVANAPVYRVSQRNMKSRFVLIKCLFSQKSFKFITPIERPVPTNPEIGVKKLLVSPHPQP